MNTILIVDDNKAICDSLTLMLELHGYTAVSCNSADQAIELISSHDIDIVIQDMNFSQDTTSGEEGVSLFYKLRDIQPDVPIILMTAWTQLETAVELVRAGAADYIGKPWDDTRLLTSITNLLALHKLSRDNKKLERANSQRMSAINKADLCGLVFGSGAMQRCIDLALQIAQSDISVLITGPNGAGKEKIAEILHANSTLKNKPFIKVNIGALPTELLEAELFGAEAGAFTGATKARIGRFEAADGGTLFLDEIGNLPLSGQVKLLRVLQTGEFERLGSHRTRKVNVRVVSATNACLPDAISQGDFREDLYYRLNVVELALPPLSQRPDDILPLVEHFTDARFSIDKPTQQALLNHAWPGNVRELENACRRATLLSKSDQLTADDFGITRNANVSPPRSTNINHSRGAFGQQSTSQTAHSTENPLETPQVSKAQERVITKAELEEALQTHRGVVARVAKYFGISRQALYRRMDKLGVEKP